MPRRASFELRAYPPVRARWAVLIAIGAGVVGVLAFPRVGAWPLALLSVGSLSFAVDGRRARVGAGLGLLYGLAFCGPLLHWTGVYVGALPWLILTVTEAVYFAGLGALLPIVQRLPAAPVWVGAAWVLQEAVRGRWPFGGFPWGRLAFSQAQSPLRWFAAVGGAPLVSFAVALGGGALGLGLLRLARERWRSAVPWLAVAVAVPALGAVLAWPLAPSPTGTDGSGRTTTIALVQGNVPDRGLNFNSRRRQVLDNHVAQTLQLAAQIEAGEVPRPSLVLWPENSSDIDPYDNADARAEITQAVDAVQVPILVGAILDGPGDHVRNVGILWSPGTGPGATYTKRHPVPFGEYIPLRGLASAVSDKVDLVSRDMAAGHGTGLVTGGPFPLGDVICFEVAYDGLVRSAVSAGAQLLVVQTNNATFGHSAETYQQLAMSRLRAIEHGRTTVQVSTSGSSAIIGPDGKVRARSGALFTPARLVATVPLRTATTLATRLGAVPELALVGVAVLAGAAGLAVGRRHRPSTHLGHDPEPDPEEMVRA